MCRCSCQLVMAAPLWHVERVQANLSRSDRRRLLLLLRQLLLPPLLALGLCRASISHQQASMRRSLCPLPPALLRALSCLTAQQCRGCDRLSAIHHRTRKTRQAAHLSRISYRFFRPSDTYSYYCLLRLLLLLFSVSPQNCWRH